MSSDFVRYSPEVETIDPKLDEYMTRIIDFWERTVRESPEREGSGRAVRGAHAKTLGVARAEVEILGHAPAPYAQGIYARPGRHDALIRFSSASNHLDPDAQLGPVLGFAIKIFDIDRRGYLGRAHAGPLLAGNSRPRGRDRYRRRPVAVAGRPARRWPRRQ